MECKRSIQIIKEAKAEIKKMESLRPSTPFNRKGLQSYGKNIGFGISRPSSSASSLSIKSLRYEREEKFCKTSGRSNLSKCVKDTGNNIDIKLEPIVTKPAFCPRKSCHTLQKRKNEPQFSGFPPLNHDRKANKDTPKTFHDKFEDLCSETKCAEESISAVDKNFNFIDQSLNNISYDKTSDTELGSYMSDPQMDETDEEQDEISEELCTLIQSLENCIKLDKRKKFKEIIPIIHEIYEVLKEKNAFTNPFNNRVYLLKLLFKLLDSNYCDLSISVIKILLQMKLKGNNITNIFRLVVKLLKDDFFGKIDAQMMDSLLKNLHETPVGDNINATIYGIRILKYLVQSINFKEEFMGKSIIILNHHLNEFINFFNFETEWNQNFNQCVIQILSILHFLSDNKNTREMLVINNSFIQIMRILQCFYVHADIVEIAVRLISKIIDKTNCEVLTSCSDDLLLNFLQVLEFHKHHIDITLQVTFIIGSLVSFNEKTALLFLSSSHFINMTVDVLEDYIHEHIQFRECLSETFKHLNSSGDRKWNEEIFEVILKILCIWANICLKSEAGCFLATQNFLISHLLSIISTYEESSEVQDTSFALYSFLVVIGNISYYLSAESNMCSVTIERVIPLLGARFSNDVRLESANIVRNLTRHSHVRDYIQENSLLQLFLNLLEEDNNDFNIAVYGIVMNLLIDHKTHKVFYQEQGVTRVLHKLHLSADRDWKTSAIMCQILWNYYCDKKEEVPISKIENQHLIKFLSYSLNSKQFESENEHSAEWKNEFCPVAGKLLELLQNKQFSIT